MKADEVMKLIRYADSINDNCIGGVNVETALNFANQRVIEELERLIEMQGDLVPKYGDIIYERDVKERIKELKQE